MRSLDQIKQAIMDDIIAINSNVRFVPGDSQHDVVVGAPSNQFYRYEALLEFENRTDSLPGFIDIIGDEVFKQTMVDAVKTNEDGTPFTIDDVNALISARLDAFVSNWGMVRQTGSKATTTIRVYLSNSNPLDWNIATNFTSKQGIVYNPLASVPLVSPNFAQGKYYVDIAVVAANPGVSGNASANSITSMEPKPANFSSCTNVIVADGGSDQENDLDLISRAQSVWQGRVNGSLPGLVVMAEEQTYVDDASTFDVDDDKNDIKIGSVCDIETQFSSEDTALAEDIVYWPGFGNADTQTFDFVMQNQPMISTIMPTVFVTDAGGVETQLIPDETNITVSLVQDTSTFQRSNKANDKVQIKAALSSASYQRKIRIVYAYDKNPGKLQNVVNDPDTRMIGSLPLVKKAISIPFQVVVEPEITFGADLTTVEADIEANIAIFFNGGTTSFGKQYARKALGEQIRHSDIQYVILRTPNVVSFDNDTFRVLNTITLSLEDPSIILANQYASLYSVVFNFTDFNLANFTANTI